MEFTQLTDQDTSRMLSAIGVDRVDQLFAGIPSGARLESPLALPDAMTEFDLLAEINRLGTANRTSNDAVCFLGGGIYDHFIPSVVADLASRNEFLTAYTPYQAEAAQGALQALYEFQTLICQLTGMDVANASLYEGGTAVAEAVLMARSINGKRRIVVSETVHPHIRQVLQSYVRSLPLDLVVIEGAAGRTNADDLRRALTDDTTAVVMQSPNFFGCIEPLDKLIPMTHEAGGLAVVSIDPISCGLLATPGSLGADIVVGDGQSLGIPMCYGGPTLGLMACRQKHMRKMPGRLIGTTTDRSGRRAFCLTLQTREQHIRRERATSNICTNQGLLALRAAIYLSAIGPEGLHRVATLCLDKSHYAADRIASLNGFDVRFTAPFFKEFVVRTTKDVRAVLRHCRDGSVLAGIELGRWFDGLSDSFLVSVTEKRTRAEIDRLVELLDEA